MRETLRAICLDYYGTLVDIGHPFGQIEQAVAKLLGTTDGTSKACISRFRRERARLTAGPFMSGQKLLLESFIRTADHFHLCADSGEFSRLIVQLFTSPPAFPDAVAAVQVLRRERPVGLLSNADEEILQESIRRQGFVFDFVVTSEGMQCNKPQQEIYCKAARLLGLEPSQILMAGDSLLEDGIAPRQAGFQSLLIDREGRYADAGIPTVPGLRELVQWIVQKEE